MDEYDLMKDGFLYIANSEKIHDLFKKKCEFLDAFNATSTGDFLTREELCRKYFRKTGKNLVVNKPFYCDYGAHIEVGDNFYANFDLIILDVADVIIGNNVFIAPRVSIYTAGHPLDKDIRNEQLEYGKKVVIGDDVWIGGNVVINPGVNIGSNVVIGSGSVVTKDIPSDSLCYGNPCKVVRKLNEDDKIFWEKEKEKRLMLLNK